MDLYNRLTEIWSNEIASFNFELDFPRRTDFQVNLRLERGHGNFPDLDDPNPIRRRQEWDAFLDLFSRYVEAIHSPADQTAFLAARRDWVSNDHRVLNGLDRLPEVRDREPEIHRLREQVHAARLEREGVIGEAQNYHTALVDTRRINANHEAEIRSL